MQVFFQVIHIFSWVDHVCVCVHLWAWVLLYLWTQITLFVCALSSCISSITSTAPVPAAVHPWDCGVGSFAFEVHPWDLGCGGARPALVPAQTQRQEVSRQIPRTRFPLCLDVLLSGPLRAALDLLRSGARGCGYRGCCIPELGWVCALSICAPALQKM